MTCEGGAYDGGRLGVLADELDLVLGLCYVLEDGVRVPVGIARRGVLDVAGTTASDGEDLGH